MVFDNEVQQMRRFAFKRLVEFLSAKGLIESADNSSERFIFLVSSSSLLFGNKFL